MKNNLASFILKIFGWKNINKVDPVDKMIVIIAPHTSTMDFIWGFLFFKSFGIKPHFLIKKEFFFFPLGPIIRAMGAIPVDRGNIRNNMVGAMKEQFDKKKKFALTITPEGTRKKVTRWKKGFYVISQETQIPITCGVIDYKLKLYGLVDRITPSGNYKEDLNKIKKHYVNLHAKHPEQYIIKFD